MKQSLRHHKIIELVRQKGYLSTEDLLATLAVSPQTIRRDLNILAELDLIRRHHGGADANIRPSISPGPAVHYVVMAELSVKQQ